MSKKQIVFYGNCHFVNYFDTLNALSQDFKDKYKSNIIYIAKYLVYELKDKVDFTEEHKLYFRNADVLVCQHIKNDRGFLNHEDIISKYIKKDCKIIKMPHYTFSGYHYPFSPNKVEIDITWSDEMILNKLNTLPITKQSVIEHFNKELLNIKALDELSAIKMYDVMVQYSKKQRLFNTRSYPTYIFFYHALQQLMPLLDLRFDVSLVDNKFADVKQHPIFPEVSKYLGLEFDTFSFTFRDINYNICDQFRLARKLDLDFINLFDIHQYEALKNIIATK